MKAESHFSCPTADAGGKMGRMEQPGSDMQAAFLGHFLRHQEDIRAVIASLVRDRTACDDIFQEVALTLWKKFDTYDGVHSFGAWARGIAVRKVLQSFDRVRRTPVALSPETIEAVVEAFDAEAADTPREEDALKVCLQKLPEKSRNLVRLRYDQGLRLEAMANLLASTLDAVNKALSRIRVELRKCIERQLAEAG